jgi:hypothetical protein
MTPRSTVIVAMAWLGLLVVTSQDWWKNVRNKVEGLTH